MKFLFLFIVFNFLSGAIYAQSKPKRDISKDKSIVVSRHKKTSKQKRMPKRKTSLMIAKNKEQKGKTNSSITKKEYTPVVSEATYLRINQLTSITKTLDAKGGTISFDVITDGENWTINSLPIWCSVSKYSKKFVVNYEANPTHEDRTDWIDVKCDGKQVRIYMSQQGMPWEI